jgi:hypothetical protein
MSLRSASNALMLSTMFIGTLFAFCAWVDVVDSRFSTKDGWKIPTSLYPFSLLVVWDFLIYLFLPSEGELFRAQFTAGQIVALYLLLLGASLAFLWATVVMVRRDSGPGKSLVAFGSKILVVTSSVFFVAMLLFAPYNRL